MIKAKAHMKLVLLLSFLLTGLALHARAGHVISLDEYRRAGRVVLIQPLVSPVPVDVEVKNFLADAISKEDYSLFQRQYIKKTDHPRSSWLLELSERVYHTALYPVNVSSIMFFHHLWKNAKDRDPETQHIALAILGLAGNLVNSNYEAETAAQAIAPFLKFNSKARKENIRGEYAKIEDLLGAFIFFSQFFNELHSETVKISRESLFEISQEIDAWLLKNAKSLQVGPFTAKLNLLTENAYQKYCFWQARNKVLELISKHSISAAAIDIFKNVIDSKPVEFPCKSLLEFDK